VLERVTLRPFHPTLKHVTFTLSDWEFPTDPSIREYVYDDTYSECRGSDTISFDQLDGDPILDSYACFVGENCDGGPCSIIFQPVAVFSSATQFLNTCVEAIVPITAPGPTPVVPSIPNDNESSYLVQFEASWANIIHTDTSQTTCAFQQDSVVNLYCDSGSTIQYLSSRQCCVKRRVTMSYDAVVLPVTM
jgi:hypothetical protein